MFKILNVIVHMLNCYFIYKIWNRRQFVLMYGLNPFILIEGISNVHNDMFVLLFILIATYMLVKKKNIILTVLFLSLATAVKYIAIIILPVFVIYYFREKPVYKRMLLGGPCIALFIAIILLFYAPFIQDLEVFKGVATQQSKIAKSIYITIRLINYKATGINRLLTITFIIMYFIKCVNLLFKKEINLKKEMRENFIYLMIFLFIIITNFNPWYLTWLYYLIFWQKKEDILYINNLCLISLFANCIFLVYTEQWQYGVIFSDIMLISIVGLKIIEKIKEQRKNKQLLQS